MRVREQTLSEAGLNVIETIIFKYYRFVLPSSDRIVDRQSERGMHPYVSPDVPQVCLLLTPIL